MRAYFQFENGVTTTTFTEKRPSLCSILQQTDLVQALVTKQDITKVFRNHLEKAMNHLLHTELTALLLQDVKARGVEERSNIKPASYMLHGISLIKYGCLIVRASMRTSKRCGQRIKQQGFPYRLIKQGCKQVVNWLINYHDQKQWARHIGLVQGADHGTNARDPQQAPDQKVTKPAFSYQQRYINGHTSRRNSQK
jgi:hypothetical protein